MRAESNFGQVSFRARSGSAAQTCGKPLAFRPMLRVSAFTAQTGRPSPPVCVEKITQDARAVERRSLSASQAAKPHVIVDRFESELDEREHRSRPRREITSLVPRDRNDIIEAALRRTGCTLKCCLFLLAALLFAALSFARDFPPAALPAKPLVLPAPALHVLPNGLKVVVIERRLLPLLTLRLVIKSGAEADPPALPGTAQLVSALLTEGTATRSARQISEAIDSIGGLVDAGAGWDESYLSLSVLNDHEELAFDLLSDMVMHSSFAPAEFERKRRQTLSGLEVVRDDPDYVADAALRRLAFLGTAYAHPEDGTLASVRRITPEDLRAFYKSYYQPSNAVLAIVGDINTSEAFERAEKRFGAWSNGAPAPSPATPPGVKSPRILAIDKPDAVQTEIRIGNLGVPRKSPDYLALSVADQILGGPSENRLFKALRSHQGLTYGASSELLSYQTAGVWSVKTFTRTAETMKSLRLALEQIKQMHDHPITPQELETAQGYLIGHLALDFESSEDVASQTLQLLVYNLPLDYWNRFPENIRALTTEEVWTAAGRRLAPENNIVVLVGNLSSFEKELKKLGPVQFVPLAEVDFSAAELVPGGGRAQTRK